MDKYIPCPKCLQKQEARMKKLLKVFSFLQKQEAKMRKTFYRRS